MFDQDAHSHFTEGTTQMTWIEKVMVKWLFNRMLKRRYEVMNLEYMFKYLFELCWDTYREDNIPTINYYMQEIFDRSKLKCGQ